MNQSFVEFNIPVTVSFPLPYRVLALGALGILGWATNIHVMDLRTEGYTPRTPMSAQRFADYFHKTNSLALYNNLYRISFTYSTVCLASWFFFAVSTRGDASLVDSFGHIPAITALALLIILLCPFNIAFKKERDKFLHAIRRCLFSSFDTTIYFSDVVFADIGTSFAKVFGDVWLSMWMLMPGQSMLGPPTFNGWLRWVLPTVMSFPYAVRFRQCIIEYNLPSNESRRPLYNALKYATSFPVIFLSAAQRLAVVDHIENGDIIMTEPWHGEYYLFRLWLLAAAINSLYSFWWDVTNDWGLDLLKFGNSDTQPELRLSPPRRLILPHLHSGTPLITRSSSESQVSEDIDPVLASSTLIRHQRTHPWGLRSKLIYPLPVYPLLVFLNLVLRMAWSIKLSSHLHLERDGSVAFFWLEIAEMARRWLWVFIRVEWEVIKKAKDGNFKELSDEEANYEMLPATPDASLVLP
ncbi:EXS family-domain-containing protein [Cyathus striatus]|nr:EXS family-domain-containing protein [Cyathus striatus]